MKKIVILIFLIITILTIPKVEAVSVRKVETGYYYTRFDPDGTRNSDKFNLHYIDDKIVYCIEPGVKLGEDYNVDELYNIPYESKLRILLAAYYGYNYQNNKHIYYALATQSIIWKEITGKYPVFSTQLFEKGSKINLDDYISLINSKINKFVHIPDIVPTKEILVGSSVIFKDNNNVLEAYNISKYDPNIDPLQGNLFNIYFTEAGNFNLKLTRIKDYDSNYKVYVDSDKQKLLMPGNIPELDYEKTFEVKKINVHFKILDFETNEEIHGVTLKFDDDYIKDTDTYVIDKYSIPTINFVSVPDGYEFNDDEYKYKNFSSSNVTLTFKLQPIYNDYVINKTYDEVNPEENAIFELINNDTNKLQGVYYTNKDGIFNLHLRYGTYTLNQLKGIEGYNLVSYIIYNTQPKTSTIKTIKLNDEKILNNNEEFNKNIIIEENNNSNENEVNINNENYTQNLVQTGNSISLLSFILFPIICLLRKKIIAI